MGLTNLTVGFGCGYYSSCSNETSYKFVVAGGTIIGVSLFFLVFELICLTCFIDKKKYVQVDYL
jgi:hypothetical protein